MVTAAILCLWEIPHLGIKESQNKTLKSLLLDNAEAVKGKKKNNASFHFKKAFT